MEIIRSSWSAWIVVRWTVNKKYPRITIIFIWAKNIQNLNCSKLNSKIVSQISRPHEKGASGQIFWGLEFTEGLGKFPKMWGEMFFVVCLVIFFLSFQNIKNQFIKGSFNLCSGRGAQMLLHPAWFGSNIIEDTPILLNIWVVSVFLVEIKISPSKHFLL